MIRSMTAFAREDLEGEWGSLTCEIRSVNHRYLEPQFRLSDTLRDLEPALREQVRDRLKRGKIEIGVRLQLSEQGTGRLSVNMDLARELNEAANHINRLLDNPAHLSALEFLRWPGVMVTEEPELEPIKQQARDLVAKTLDRLVETREREGQRLKPLFDERLDAIKQTVAQLRDRLPTILERQREAMRERLAQVQVDVDEDRLAQEMAMIAQKADVAEELDRLEAHVDEVRATLDKDESIGRRLDFLMQELNREANTLSSKSIDTGLTQAAVELKVLIEQMREQVQNIE
ncbi:YicC/YloC family endoribonuclease [Marinobacteraceae bacterium S3BR75-40.1]